MAKCKYCGIEIKSGQICSYCSAKYKLVKKLIKLCEPLKAYSEGKQEMQSNEQDL